MPRSLLHGHQVCGKNGSDYQRNAKRYRRERRALRRANRKGVMVITPGRKNFEKALGLTEGVIERWKKKAARWNMQQMWEGGGFGPVASA